MCSDVLTELQTNLKWGTITYSQLRKDTNTGDFAGQKIYTCPEAGWLHKCTDPREKGEILEKKTKQTKKTPKDLEFLICSEISQLAS